jgi:aryl-alcohol dehydrogenase-like predicted oxidoreductase
MIKRKLGKNGPEISSIGFGGWGIGGKTPGNSSYGKTNNDDSLETIEFASNNNVQFFDTSPAYGNGVSEELIGQALSNSRKNIILSTKIGYSSWSEGADFNHDKLAKSLESSLKRLKTNYIDVLWLHSPPGNILFEDKKIFHLLDKFKKDKLINQWGVSCKSPNEGMELLQQRDLDLLQVNFNMMDIRAFKNGLFDLCKDRGVGIVARTPLCFGFLTGKINKNTVFPEGDHRRNWSKNQIKTWIDGTDKILSLLEVKPGAEACKSALRFCLSFPAVSVVLPGALYKNEVKEQVEAGNEGVMDKNKLNKVIELHDKFSFYSP